MWTTVYLGQDFEKIRSMKKLLEDNGILVRVRPLDKGGEGGACGYEVLVPAAEVNQAQNLIIDSEF